MKHKRITLTLPENIWQDLQTFSSDLNEKKSEMVANALSIYFDIKDTMLANKRYNQFKEDAEEGVSLKDIRQELGL